MSDEKRAAAGKCDDEPGRWPLALFALGAVVGLGALGGLAWAVIRVKGKRRE